MHGFWYFLVFARFVFASGFFGVDDKSIAATDDQRLVFAM